jgi:SAM-dependent methyltransferase
VRLNLGASDRGFPGFLSVDIEPPADFVTDLRSVWPWPDSSVEEALAFDVFEHLPDKRHTMNELWRVLQPGGVATIGVPDATQGDGGFCMSPTGPAATSSTSSRVILPASAFEAASTTGSGRIFRCSRSRNSGMNGSAVSLSRFGLSCRR